MTDTNNKNHPLWTDADAAAATGGDNTAPWQASGVSIDTRTLAPGDLFVALKGDSHDGHLYVTSAQKAGAAAALVSRDFRAENPDFPLLRVDETLDGLEKLAHAARARSRAKIIGVTGSAGKTGTKEMLATVLGEQGLTHASKKSFNNHWGVPLSLAALPAEAKFGVFEMGMNHAGELTRLTEMVRPDIAIITTIEPAHIENFPSVEAIADAKAEIFTGMAQGSVAILNIDNPHYQRLRQAAEKQSLRVVTFGEDDAADVRLVDCTLHADSSKATTVIDGKKLKLRLAIPGMHIVHNALAVLAAARAAGADLDKAAAAIRNSEPVEGRGNRLQVVIEDGAPPVTVIDESYNANPASMAAAISVLAMTEPAEGGRRIAVLGDMLELGRDGPQLHAELANPLLRARTELVFCCGPQMEALWQVLPPDWRGGHDTDSKDLAPLVTSAVRPGDVVLVKGSAGSKMAYIVQALHDLNRSHSASGDQRHAL